MDEKDVRLDGWAQLKATCRLAGTGRSWVDLLEVPSEAQTSTTTSLARKTFVTTGESSEEQRFIDNEVTLLQSLQHPHVIRYVDSCRPDEHHMSILMAFAPQGDLHHYLQERKEPVSEVDALSIMQQVAVALEYVHEQGVVHRDLKPGNILMDNGTVKLGDFGLARRVIDTTNVASRSGAGTYGYVAPEQYQDKYGKPVDIWASGVVLYELLMGERPWLKNEYGHVLRAIEEGRAQPMREGVSMATLSLIRWCMSIDPHLRPTATDLRRTISTILTRGNCAQEDLAFVRPWVSWLVRRPVVFLRPMQSVALVPSGRGTSLRNAARAEHGELWVDLVLDMATGDTFTLRSMFALNHLHCAQISQRVDKLRRLQHPHVVCCVDCVVDEDGHAFVVMEYAPKEIFEVHKGPVAEDKALELMLQAARGLEFLHTLTDESVERAMAWNSVRVMQDGTVKLDNLGLSEEMIHQATGNRRTGAKSLKEKACGKAADIVSFGQVLFCLLVGSLPSVDIKGELLVTEPLQINETCQILLRACFPPRCLAASDIARQISSMVDPQLGPCKVLSDYKDSIDVKENIFVCEVSEQGECWSDGDWMDGGEDFSWCEVGEYRDGHLPVSLRNTEGCPVCVEDRDPHEFFVGFMSGFGRLKISWSLQGDQLVVSLPGGVEGCLPQLIVTWRGRWLPTSLRLSQCERTYVGRSESSQTQQRDGHGLQSLQPLDLSRAGIKAGGRVSGTVTTPVEHTHSLMPVETQERWKCLVCGANYEPPIPMDLLRCELCDYTECRECASHGKQVALWRAMVPPEYSHPIQRYQLARCVTRTSFDNGRSAVVKSVRVDKRNDLAYLENEVFALKRLDHPHVIRHLHSYVEGDNVHLIMEDAANGDLETFLERAGRRQSQRDAFDIFVQVCEGLAYVHSRGFIHRNVKPAHVLVMHDMTVKLGGFAFCFPMASGDCTDEVGTLGYKAPEMCYGLPCGPAVDIWSMAVLLCKLLTNDWPWEEKRMLKFLDDGVMNPVATAALSSDTVGLLQDCFSVDPVGRPTAQDLLSRVRAIVANMVAC